MRVLDPMSTVRDEVRVERVAEACVISSFAGVIPGRVRSTRAGFHTPPAVVMGSELAATRRPGTTSDAAGL